MNRKSAFTLIELLVVIAIISLLIAILLPSLSAARVEAQKVVNSTNLRGIHQGMILFAESNNGYYPGLDSRGETIGFPPSNLAAPSLAAGDAFEGIVPHGLSASTRLAILLNGDYCVPKQLVSPGDQQVREARGHAGEDADNDGTPDGMVNTFSPGGSAIPNFSYAILGFRFTAATAEFANKDHEKGRYQEWRNTGNTNAIIAVDRVLGSPYYSVWTKNPSGDGTPNWSGTVVRNDNSTTFEKSHILKGSQYGKLPFAADDDIFSELDIDPQGNAAAAWMRWD